MSKLNSLLHTYYFQVIDIWNRLCEEHTELFESTCQEYKFLLDDDLTKLEEQLAIKEKIILKINALDSMRSSVIKKIEDIERIKVECVGDLINIMNEFETYNNQRHIWRFNELLIDIIGKIQDQNKKNQIFINKAQLSLQEIKDEVMGQKSYSTYNAHGIAKNKSIEKSFNQQDVEDF